MKKNKSQNLKHKLEVMIKVLKIKSTLNCVATKKCQINFKDRS